MVECCEAPHTYVVVSPEFEIFPGNYHGFSPEPPEYGCTCDYVTASSKREAVRVAYADPGADLHLWVKHARGEGVNPFGGLSVEHPVCEHGWCIDAAWDEESGDVLCPGCYEIMEAEFVEKHS